MHNQKWIQSTSDGGGAHSGRKSLPLYLSDFHEYARENGRKIEWLIFPSPRKENVTACAVIISFFCLQTL